MNDINQQGETMNPINDINIGTVIKGRRVNGVLGTVTDIDGLWLLADDENGHPFKILADRVAPSDAELVDWPV